MAEIEGQPTWVYTFENLEEFGLGWSDVNSSPAILANSSLDDKEEIDPLLVRIPKSDHLPKVENNFRHSPDMKLLFKIQSMRRNLVNEYQKRYIADPLDYIGTQPDIEVRYRVR